MTRPIVWASGVAIVAAVWGMSFAATIDRTVPKADLGRARPVEALNESRRHTIAPTPQRSGPSGTLTVFADPRGHFAVDAIVEGQVLPMLVDTGATVCALTYEDARRAGLQVDDRDFVHPMQTANGIVRAAPVRIGMLRVGGIMVQAVDAMVMPRGRLGISLLGMSFLRRLSEFSMANGRLTLRG